MGEATRATVIDRAMGITGLPEPKGLGRSWMVDDSEGVDSPQMLWRRTGEPRAQPLVGMSRLPWTKAFYSLTLMRLYCHPQQLEQGDILKSLSNALQPVCIKPEQNGKTH